MSRHRDTEIRHRSVSTNTVSPSPIDRTTSLEKTYEIVVSEKEREHYSQHEFMRNDKEIYEQQLTQLQEQLEAVTIEKENLALQLKKAKKAKEKLQLEATVLRRRNTDLACNDSSQIETTGDVSDGKPSWVGRLIERAVSSLYSIVEDFKVREELEGEGESEGEPLTAKRLKANIQRFGAEFKPYIDTVKGIQNLLMWKSPSYTLMVFMIYLYAVWTGHLMQVILFCFAFRHFICLLQSVGFNIKFNFLHVEEEKKEDRPEMKLLERVNLALEVARKVQNGLDSAADSLEKIKSVLLWRHVPTAKRIFFFLSAACIASLFVPFDQISTYMGIGMGIKLFIINCFFTKYPRLNEKYNTTHKMWKSLPTQAQWEKQQAKSQIHKYILEPKKEEDVGEKEAEESVSTTNAGTSMRSQGAESPQLSKEDQEFCELFYLPESECPLEGWQGGKRCSVINKEKSLISAFKNGKLYLTRSFLCFERSRKPSKSNLVIPLADITSVQKIKPYTFLPGSGMAIEVVVKQKAFIFGGIINRDEAYEQLLEVGASQLLPWAIGIMPEGGSSAMSHSVRLRKTSSGQFSFPDEYVDSD